MRGAETFRTAEGREVALRFGNREFCQIEEEFGQSFLQVVAGLEGTSFRFGLFRRLFRIGLSRGMPGVTDDAAGDLIDEIGLEEAVRMFERCIRDALPQKGGKAQGEGTAAA